MLLGSLCGCYGYVVEYVTLVLLAAGTSLLLHCAERVLCTVTLLSQRALHSLCCAPMHSAALVRFVPPHHIAHQRTANGACGHSARVNVRFSLRPIRTTTAARVWRHSAASSVRAVSAPDTLPYCFDVKFKPREVTDSRHYASTQKVQFASVGIASSALTTSQGVLSWLARAVHPCS